MCGAQRSLKASIDIDTQLLMYVKGESYVSSAEVKASPFGRWEIISQVLEKYYLLSNHEKFFYSPAWAESRLCFGSSQRTVPFGLGSRDGVPLGPDTKLCHSLKGLSWGWG